MESVHATVRELMANVAENHLPDGHAFFKEGHDEGTANYALCVQEQRARAPIPAGD